MEATNTFIEMDWLEVRSCGDYSFIQVGNSGTARKSAILHNGGIFYCWADKYEHYRQNITEEAR